MFAALIQRLNRWFNTNPLRPVVVDAPVPAWMMVDAHLYSDDDAVYLPDALAAIEEAMRTGIGEFLNEAATAGVARRCIAELKVLEEARALAFSLEFALSNDAADEQAMWRARAERLRSDLQRCLLADHSMPPDDAA